MNFILKSFKPLVIFLTGMTIFSCGTSDDPGDVIIPENTINNYFINSSDYTVLAAALNITSLDTLLKASGQYTVFAPTNSAFNSFLSENDYTNLNDIPVDVLRNNLLYHIISGARTLEQFPQGYLYSAATGNASDQGLSLYTYTQDESLYINSQAQIPFNSGNISLENGYVHPLASFLSLPNLDDFLKINSGSIQSDFYSLISGYQTRDYTQAFQNRDSLYTILQASPSAVGDFLAENDYQSIGDIPEAQRDSLVNANIIPNRNIRSSDLEDTLEVVTANGQLLKFYEEDGVKVLRPNGEVLKVLNPDIQAVNGVIHVVDQLSGVSLEN